MERKDLFEIKELEELDAYIAIGKAKKETEDGQVVCQLTASGDFSTKMTLLTHLLVDLVHATNRNMGGGAITSELLMEAVCGKAKEMLEEKNKESDSVTNEILETLEKLKSLVDSRKSGVSWEVVPE